MSRRRGPAAGIGYSRPAGIRTVRREARCKSRRKPATARRPSTAARRLHCRVSNAGSSMKRTYQPKKRKRARTHGFRRAAQHPLGSGDPEAPAAEGPQAADPLTLATRAAAMHVHADACPAAATSTASTGTAARAATASWSSTPSPAARTRPPARPAWALGRPQGRRRRAEEQGEARDPRVLLEARPGAARRPRLRDRRPPRSRGAGRARRRRRRRGVPGRAGPQRRRQGSGEERLS